MMGALEPTRRGFRWPPAEALLIAALLVEPLAISTLRDANGPAATVTWPRIWSGDEPHYLVMINSLIGDGDLDLRNNYAQVHAGSFEAGQMFAGLELDHHTKWYDAGRLTAWYEVYETRVGIWQRDAAGHPVPTLRPGKQSIAPPSREYSWHPPGMPVLRTHESTRRRNTMPRR